MIPFIATEIKVDKWPQLIERYPHRVGDIVEKIARDGYAGSQLTVPFLTGALKNSGQVAGSSDRFTWEITYSMHYAGYVHEGTIHMSPRPWLRNACERLVPIMELAFGELEKQLVS